MTSEDAIEIIDMAITEVEWEYPMDYAVAFDLARKALEKHIPQKPLIVRKHTHYYECPKCHEALSFKHICECGQMIDWEED